MSNDDLKERMIRLSDELWGLNEKINVCRAENKIPPSEMTIRAEEIAGMLATYFRV